MMKLKTSFLPIFLAFILLIWLFYTLPAAAQTTPQLRLHRSQLPLDSNTDPRATLLLNPVSGNYAIIQFAGPISPPDRAAILATGVQILEYMPDYAYLVTGTVLQLDAAANLPQVYARYPFTLADKLAPSLIRRILQGETNMGMVLLAGWPDDTGQLAAALAAAGIDPTLPLDMSQLIQVANLPELRWIEPVGQPFLLNDVARNIMNVHPTWTDLGLYGNGQILAIADSGLDTGSFATLSPDFQPGRIVAAHALVLGQNWDDNHGHGTHVVGSAAGAGVQSGADPSTHNYAISFAGVAPEASLVIQGFEADPGTGTVTGIPADYYQLFAQAYGDGARLHSNSWGDYTGPITDTAASFGAYPYGAQRTDQFMWDNPDMTIFAAAGNSGVDGVPGVFGFCVGGNGVIDPDSLLSPATAKNVITVGATENVRPTGPLAGVPWLLLNFCFATQPIAGDDIANNASGMAAFSSRGPTDDGRAKPDIVAPGTSIVSNASHVPGATTLWSPHETNTHYNYSGGTSMSTPLVAGMGTLVRQWLVMQGVVNPSAALVKATLLNTTFDNAPGQYGTGTTQEIPYARPNSVAGWGRADLTFATRPAPFVIWQDDHTAGLSSGSIVTYSHNTATPLNVISDTLPLRVMLVWTDPPASLSASAQLVNDLDLVVIGPGGVPYFGNNVATGDRLNNVEGVVIDTPPLGMYQVVVRGFNVPVATQSYALSVSGITGLDPTAITVRKMNAAASPLPVYLITGLGILLGLTGVALRRTHAQA